MKMRKKKIINNLGKMRMKNNQKNRFMNKCMKKCIKIYQTIDINNKMIIIMNKNKLNLRKYLLLMKIMNGKQRVNMKYMIMMMMMNNSELFCLIKQSYNFF